MIHDPQLVRAILREDLCCFIQAAFPTVSPGASFAPNWHIEANAFALTRVLKGEIKRLIITVPPRSLKSICTSVDSQHSCLATTRHGGSSVSAMLKA